MTKLIALCALALVCSLSSPAQQAPLASEAPGQSPSTSPTLTPRSHEERESRYRAEHRIVLNVLVTDAALKPVTGLTQEDFTLLDNRQTAKIASVRAMTGSAPSSKVHAILMLDAVNNSARNVANTRREIERYLGQRQAPLPYPTAIAILSASGAEMGQSTRDAGALTAELSRRFSELRPYECADIVEGEDQPQATGTLSRAAALNLDPAPDRTRAGTCLNQRFQLSLSALKRLARRQIDVPGRAILIWTGSGWPLLTSREFRPDTPEIKRNFYDNLVALSTSLREAQLTLDAVSAPDLFRRAELRSDSDNAFFDGVPSENEMAASRLRLQALAHQSGGQILDQSKDIAGGIDRCLADAESYYALAFDSAPAAAPGEYHSLDVKVNRPGLTVRTNTNYYAAP